MELRIQLRPSVSHRILHNWNSLLRHSRFRRRKRDRLPNSFVVAPLRQTRYFSRTIALLCPLRLGHNRFPGRYIPLNDSPYCPLNVPQKRDSFHHLLIYKPLRSSVPDTIMNSVIIRLPLYRRSCFIDFHSSKIRLSRRLFRKPRKEFTIINFTFAYGRYFERNAGRLRSKYTILRTLY